MIYHLYIIAEFIFLSFNKSEYFILRIIKGFLKLKIKKIFHFVSYLLNILFQKKKKNASRKIGIPILLELNFNNLISFSFSPKETKAKKKIISSYLEIVSIWKSCNFQHYNSFAIY
jgi:hypothetical protein